jgi:hypothetical protein
LNIFGIIEQLKSGVFMPRTDVIRAEVQRSLRSTPFHPFALLMENGDRIVVEHPENIAFDPADNGTGGSEDFYVISSRLRHFSSFGAVTSVALVDQGRPTS